MFKKKVPQVVCNFAADSLVAKKVRGNEIYKELNVVKKIAFIHVTHTMKIFLCDI